MKHKCGLQLFVSSSLSLGYEGQDAPVVQEVAVRVEVVRLAQLRVDEVHDGWDLGFALVARVADWRGGRGEGEGVQRKGRARRSEFHS